MAYHPLIFVAILLVATATTANCLIINGTEIFQIQILGRVTCIAPPPPPPSGTEPVLNGTNVALVCAGSNKSLVQAVADINGFYRLVYNTVDSVLFDPSECFAVVRLPIVRCRVYPPTGTLRATLTLVGLLQPLFNAIAIVAAGPFQLVT